MTDIFISSTIRDLAYVRATLADKIESLLGHRAVVTESVRFEWSKGIVESCLKAVRDCDVYVLMVGDRYGTLNPKSKRSITHDEYREAVVQRKPIYILIHQDTWALYERAPLTLEPGLAEFIREISGEFRNNVRKFLTSEDAYTYIKEQLALLLRSYLRVGYQPDELRDTIMTKDIYARANRLFHAMIKYGEYHHNELRRVLSVFASELQPSHFLTGRHTLISSVSGATLHRIDAEGRQMIHVAGYGNVGSHPPFQVDDPESYVSMTYKTQAVKIFMKDEIGGRECILCIPMAGRYVMTLHFIVDDEDEAVQEDLYRQMMLGRNKLLFDVMHLYLERSVDHETTIEA